MFIVMSISLTILPIMAIIPIKQFEFAIQRELSDISAYYCADFVEEEEGGYPSSFMEGNTKKKR